MNSILEGPHETYLKNVGHAEIIARSLKYLRNSSQSLGI